MGFGRPLSLRPLAASQRADSGATKAMATATTTGVAQSAAMPRQPRAWKRMATTAEAATTPTAAGTPMLEVIRVRRRRGVYSLIRANWLEPAPP